ARDCLVGQDRRSVEGVFLCSTTMPFADRQNAGIAATALNLDPTVFTADFAASLRAGTTGLMAALDAVAAGSRRNVLVAAADRRETKPAYFYEMWFGDGAAAVLVGRENVIAEFLGAHTVSYDFVDHYRAADRHYDYTWEERWLREEGYSRFIPEAVAGLLKKLGLTMADVQKLVFPCLFPAEHRAIAKRLGAAPETVVDTMQEVCGETGAAHPLLMLAAALETAKPGDGILVCGFGQGCDALYFRVTAEIAKLPPRRGVQGSLKEGKSTDNYMKFLKFRGLINPEMGIRAEAPTQTAMTTLWRNRKMLTALVGGRCTQCGTPQFPRQDICVNPDCGAVGTQEDYAFADVPAKVLSFTGDLLSVSVDPPAIYGTVTFEGGGRFMADFTDCELPEIKVGMPVRMVFRRRLMDEQRGFVGYFWKAVPLPSPQGTPEAKPLRYRFDGRVALVTGAGGGLGRVYALELAKRGCKVVVNDWGGARDGSGAGSTAAADGVVAEIRAAGGEAVANYDSVATPEGGAAMVKTALDAFGRLDILINNAGILRDKGILKMEPENWRAVMDVHLHGAYHVTRPAFEVMRNQGYGRIIMTTSAAGLYGNFGQTNYSAAKMGLVGFMNSLKLEGSKYNITVNTVAPIAASRLTQDVLPPDLFAKLKPEFVAPLVLYLCSEECRETGKIYNAGMGYYNRAAVFTGKGTTIGDGITPPTVEEIQEAWEKIGNMQGAREYFQLMDLVGEILNAFQKKEEAPAQTGGEMTVAGIFDRMTGAFQAERAAGVN
ncbi:MAG: SDR family NAD(P)-dependent oxidoreductase, partial [Syntrophales bacterium]|nr:SDR family NAD(P)-dependent oxidoreductase [Syntrophales bacterium]